MNAHNTIDLSPIAQEIFNNLSRLGPTIHRDQIPFSQAGDELYSWLLFKKTHDRSPTHQMLFNDFLYRMKISSEMVNPLRVFVTDKEWVKLYIKATVGELYNIPTIAILKSNAEIENYIFPEICCVKPTHLSGAVILRKEPNLPINKSEIKKWLTINHYLYTREANYKSLIPKIIVEPLIFNHDNVIDYRFYCYMGKVTMIQADRDHTTTPQRLTYSSAWELQSFNTRHPIAKTEVSKPNNLATMISLAEKLAEPFNFIRVDLYSDGQTCLVGELTNCPGNACNAFIPSDAEAQGSAMIFGLLS